MPTDQAEDASSLNIEDYPAQGKVPDDRLEKELSDSSFGEEPSDGEVIWHLRELGVAVIRADYRGGHDEAFYNLQALFDEEGKEVTDQKEIARYIDGLGWNVGPEVIAVDRAFGSYGFTGAGGGVEYGGTVEMRLDTLQTREVSEYTYQPRRTSYENAEWESGGSAL